MPAPKKKTKKRKPVSGQAAADRKALSQFSFEELSRGIDTKSSTNRAKKEMAIGVKPSSRFRGGLSSSEKGFMGRFKKGKRT